MLQRCVAPKIAFTNRLMPNITFKSIFRDFRATLRQSWILDSTLRISEFRSGLWILSPWNSDSGLHPSAEFRILKPRIPDSPLFFLLFCFVVQSYLTFEIF